MILVRQIQVGSMANFSYLLTNPTEKIGTVIDPGWAGEEVDRTIKVAEKVGISIKHIINTHTHYDHIGGINEMMKKTGADFYVHGEEATQSGIKDRKLLNDGDRLDLDGLTVQVIHTPGHSPGGICFYVEGKLFTGDTLFVGGCGRADLPRSDPHQLYSSLYNKILSLPDETVIYPGHDYGERPTSTVGIERKSNPYLTCDSINEFLRRRMG